MPDKPHWLHNRFNSYIFNHHFWLLLPMNKYQTLLVMVHLVPFTHHQNQLMNQAGYWLSWYQPSFFSLLTHPCWPFSPPSSTIIIKHRYPFLTTVHSRLNHDQPLSTSIHHSNQAPTRLTPATTNPNHQPPPLSHAPTGHHRCLAGAPRVEPPPAPWGSSSRCADRGRSSAASACRPPRARRLRPANRETSKSSTSY